MTHQIGDPVLAFNGKNQYRYSTYQEMNPVPLPPGYYALLDDMQGMYLRAMKPPKADEVVSLETGVTKNILEDIANFSSEETKAAFKRYGFVHRRGLILHGPQGTGKSVIFRRVAKQFVEQGGIVFWDPQPSRIIRHKESMKERIKDQPILVVWEELDDWLSDSEHEILQLLDGYNTMDNCIYLGSTNHYENLPPRIRNRPSRFARNFLVGPPDTEMRKEFLAKRIHKDDLKTFGPDKFNELVQSTEGLVVDHLKEIIVSVFCMKVDMQEAISRARDMDLAEDD